jgi:PTH1 family peptidyl-tRNA hydrolase
MVPDAGEWKMDKNLNAHVAKMKIAGKAVAFVLPDTFMNNSGKSVKPLVVPMGVVDKKKIEKSAEKVMVVYDDMDLPFGSAKISFNRSSGGHKGVESIIKSIKTEKFARVRIGVTPTTPTGKLKKPQGEDAVHKFILGAFKPDELTFLKKEAGRVLGAIETFIAYGVNQAMTDFN